MDILNIWDLKYLHIGEKNNQENHKNQQAESPLPQKNPQKPNKNT